jgi:NDP-sugar pyrophosphorylase family protein
MKAVILAGGEGTRLRPLTLTTPKPVVPVVDRPFLRHQIDLLAGAGVREVVFSVAYRPERVEAVFGDGSSLGVRIRYAVEDTPLGTGGAVRNALDLLDGRTVVLNGDVLTDVDLSGVIARHEAEGAQATILLTPVPNPAAYGLVETDGEGRVLRFLEKPRPEQITTSNINAGIYVLETRVLEMMPAGVNTSIERVFFPALLARGDRVLGPVHRGYWIDIGTPEKYLQVHRDILNRRFRVPLDGAPRGDGFVHDKARVSSEALLDGHFYVGPGCEVDAGARLGPDAVLVADVRVETGAYVRDSVVWAGARIAAGCEIEGSLVGPGVRVGASSRIRGAVLGEGSVVSDFSRTL